VSAKTFVSCLVSRGFFSSEYYVTLSNGDAFFVDRNNVNVDHEPASRAETVAGRVEACVIDQTTLDLLVELPGEPVAGGLRSWIPRSDADPLYIAA
jgi:hypothetical protein